MAPERRPRFAAAAVEVAVALAVFAGLAVALTWPVAAHLREVIVGGGELGGWTWRQWWHFEEVRAIGASDLGPVEALRTLVALGRYPETGNILDILLLSWPLDRLFGFPVQHNLKVLVILTGNGLAAYALARSFTRSRLVALAAGALGIVNPLVIQDVNKTGLRQVLLWWLLLYPVALARAERTGRALDGAVAGALFALTAAFYWFYGLFAAMFSAIHLGAWALRERPRPRAAARWLGPMALTAGVGVLLFLAPYFSEGREAGGQGGVTQLPEVSFFLPFPSYDTIASAPLRPSTYRDNVLASLHRTIDSAWPADYVINPRHGVLAFPALAFLLGVLPAIRLRRARAWLLTWLVFWVGTLGPFLKLGALRDTSEVVRLGDYVVRLPFALMWTWIPGMSRMFAPYRMASMVVVASVVLLAMSLDRLRPLRRGLLALVALAGIALQPFYRFDLGPVGEGQARPAMWRVPTQVSAFSLPSWYAGLEDGVREGIIELPLDQQQDLICAYQAFHHRKVYRSWATPAAIPPAFRRRGGGPDGRLLRWLAAPDPRRDPAREVFRALSLDPLSAPLDALAPEDLRALMEAADYRWLVVHERGYYLIDPREGGVLYRHVVRALAERLGIEPARHVDQEARDWPGRRRSFPVNGAWVPWASQEVQLPAEEMPDRFGMAVFDLAALRDGASGDGDGPAAPLPEGAGEAADPPPP